MNTEIFRLFKQYEGVANARHALRQGRGKVSITDGTVEGEFQLNGLNDKDILQAGKNIVIVLKSVQASLIAGIMEELAHEQIELTTKLAEDLKGQADGIKEAIEGTKGSQVP